MGSDQPISLIYEIIIFNFAKRQRGQAWQSDICRVVRPDPAAPSIRVYWHLGIEISPGKLMNGMGGCLDASSAPHGTAASYVESFLRGDENLSFQNALQAGIPRLVAREAA